ncbi:MAG: C4-type zinc ribbon domain-containing protein [Paludibacter sp.]|nr:C4-type zinc ribbon domain-containing protein [Paludibacter sp.]MDD4197879.1 C4-type zinc ribbon domain-containing protein [Paludibacter sp.]MDD4428131.1 C4-type zinc ribbon domain-containing protein [Paludibacter sp.]
MTAAESKIEKEISVEEKLFALYDLQKVVSKIDEIKILRGELPLEVQDLEDEIIGLNTRIEHFEKEISEYTSMIASKKVAIEESRIKIERYQEQQKNVRNNREHENLEKEIEFQTLEIELSEKHIREYKAAKEAKAEEQKTTAAQLAERKLDLEEKRGELEEIIAETKQEEEKLRERAKEIEARIEPRLLTAFKRIRKNARNGLAVVYINRDACGGCFNKIPAQKQLDIRLRKKIIVCEYCGRILVDQQLAGIAPASAESTE